MDFEKIKLISENLFINMGSIINCIKTQDQNIYTFFRMSLEEILSVINNKYNIIQPGESFYNRFINSNDGLNYLMVKLRCDPKLMKSINEIQKNGNNTIHNKIKIFEIKDVKEKTNAILLLSKKYLKSEGFEYDYEKVELYKYIDELIKNESRKENTISKDSFASKLKNYDEELSLLYMDLETDDSLENKRKFIDKMHELCSYIIEYIIEYDTRFTTIEDLVIGDYSELYKVYYKIKSILNYDSKEDIFSSIYSCGFDINDTLKTRFNISCLKWLIDYYDQKADYVISDYKELASAIDYTVKEPSTEYDIKNNVYYIERQTCFHVDEETYYSISLKKAIDDDSKIPEVYSKIKLPTNYAISLSLVSTEVNLINTPTTIYVIKEYSIAIRPCEIKNLIFAVTGREVEITKSSLFYRNLMHYLSQNKCCLLDVVDTTEDNYNKFLEIFENKQSKEYIAFEEALNKIRKIILENIPETGTNILRYFLYSLRNKTLKRQISKNPNYNIPGLFFSKRCLRFDRNPYSFNLLGTLLKTDDLTNCIPVENYREDKFVKLLCNKRVADQTLFNDLSIYGDEASNDIETYNKGLWANNSGQISGVIEKIDNYSYSKDELEEIKNIYNFVRDKEKNYSVFNLFETYKEAKNKFIKEYLIDSKEKLEILNKSFNNFRIALITGEAGTGKTELLCNYYANIFKNSEILFVSNTHTCLNNMRKRVEDKIGLLPNFKFRTIKSIVSKQETLNPDVIIMDECKSISNRDMSNFIKYIAHTLFVILAGDVGQIDAIELGNWFEIICEYAKKENVFRLENNYRSNNQDLSNVWKKVRNHDQDTLNYLIDNKYLEKINDSLFERKDEDEIILCLNYKGTYGINNINSYFQNRNPHPAFVNNLEKYKVGDPVLFNENASMYNNDYIYNNLKGKIVDIREVNNELVFRIRIDIYISKEDCHLVIANNKTENWSEISINVAKYSDVPNDDRDEKYKVPFTVTYALSIHKAQGLEYKSVKLIITPESEELINNKIFYTAITRAKEKLKIFITKNDQEKIIDILNEDVKREDLTLLRRLLPVDNNLY